MVDSGTSAQLLVEVTSAILARLHLTSQLYQLQLLELNQVQLIECRNGFAITSGHTQVILSNGDLDTSKFMQRCVGWDRCVEAVISGVHGNLKCLFVSFGVKIDTCRV